jgi:hypothetical protein
MATMREIPMMMEMRIAFSMNKNQSIVKNICIDLIEFLICDIIPDVVDDGNDKYSGYKSGEGISPITRLQKNHGQHGDQKDQIDHKQPVFHGVVFGLK